MWTFTVGTKSGVSNSLVNSALAIVEEAAEIWGRYLDFGGSAIDIEVNFISLDSEVLAQAGPDYYFDSTYAGHDVYQAATIIELVTGSDLNGSSSDIQIDINSDALKNNEFYLGGADAASVPSSLYDLLTVILHEIGHGLGILSFTGDPSGDMAVYDKYVTQVGGDFYFTGAAAIAAYGGNVPLYSEPSHFAFSDLMNATVANGLRKYISEVDIAVLDDVGAPVLKPTTGNDVLYGYDGSSNDTISLLAGNDLYYGLGGADTAYGGDGDDTLVGGKGVDELNGENGDDTFIDEGANEFNGGADFDTVTYESSSTAIYVKLYDTGSGGTGVSGAAAGAVYFSIESVIGTSLADTIYGAENDEFINGGNGDDRLYGYDAAIVGSDGADTIFGGGGNDTIGGGNGDDSLTGDAGRDSIAGGDGADTLFGFGSHDTLYGGAGNDDIRGGYGKDQIGGSSDNDVLRGYEGDDALYGGGGADSLLGNEGNDVLIGGGGADILKGDDGDDTLNGSYGNDTVTGGAGDDIFQFRKTHAADTIKDFVAGAGSEDKIQLIAFGASFDSFAEVVSAATQVGADTVIDFGGGDTLTLLNTSLAALHEDDFLFT